MTNLDSYLERYDEQTSACLLAVAAIILRVDKTISQSISYGMPFFYFNGKRLAYLWVDKKLGQPYIGFTDGDKMEDPVLIKGDRKRMKIFMLDKAEDLPVAKIKALVNLAISCL